MNKVDISSEAVERLADKVTFECVNSEIDRTLAGEINATLRAQAERVKELEGLLRNVVAHATGGKTTGAGLSEAEISNHIIDLRVEIFTRGKVAGRFDALREAADKLYQRFYPQNEESDWTEFAKVHADVAIEARRVILALIEGDTND